MRLTLVPLDAARLDSLAAGDTARELAGFCHAGPAEVALARRIAVATRAMHARQGGVPVAPWTGYLAVEAGPRRLVGTCAFKGAPRAGAVEIAYFTLPGEGCRGVGRAMASDLVALAFADAGVARVLAHTAPVEGASPRLLRHLGFACQGLVEAPEEGTVWRWTRDRTTPA